MDARRSPRGSYIVRLWQEDHDPVIRGTITDVDDGTTVAGRGIDELVALFERILRDISS